MTSEEPTEVEPGLWCVRLPLRGHNVGHVNVYVLAAPTGLLLVDTGWGSEGCWETFDSQLASVGLHLADVAVVLITHIHADHFGLAGALRARNGAEVVLHPVEAANLDGRYFETEPYEKESLRWAAEAGVPPHLREVLITQIHDLASRVQRVDPAELTVDQAPVRHGSWLIEPVPTPGHSAGHTCYFERGTGTLFTGDSVFPRINASPSYRPQSSADPVGDYLAALQVLEGLPAVRALPGHQRPFPAPRDRVRELRRYHEQRLEEVRELLAEGPCSAWDVASRIGRARRWEDIPELARLTAVGETYAHLRHLEFCGLAGTDRTKSHLTWEVAA